MTNKDLSSIIWCNNQEKSALRLQQFDFISLYYKETVFGYFTDMTISLDRQCVDSADAF
jgi:hypothetical protein